MLVNINLLPQREKKNVSSLVLLALSVVLFIGGGGWLYFEYQSLKLELSTAQQQLTMAQKLREVEEQKGSQNVSASTVSQLESIVKWAEIKPVSTVVVLRHLVSALPEYGLFLQYQYSGERTVNITVQLDTIPEVSAYLHRLEKDPIIQEVKLSNVTAVAIEPTKTSEERSDTLTTDEEQDQYQFMPRYQAQFQLKLDVDKVKEEKGGAK